MVAGALWPHQTTPDQRSALLTRVLRARRPWQNPRMADLTGIDIDRVRVLDEAENARFVEERPRSMAALERARNTMPRGVPMSWMDDLYEHPPVVVTSGQGAISGGGVHWSVVQVGSQRDSSLVA